MGLVNPCEGSREGLLALSAELTEQSEAFVTVKRMLQDARAGRVSVWTGGSAEGWDRQAGAVHDSFQTVEDAYVTVIAAISVYVTELERIEREYKTVKTSYSAAVDAAPTGKKYLPGEEGRRAQQNDYDAYHRKIRAQEDKAQGLMDDRTAADNAFVDTVRAAMPESWFAVFSALRSVGIRDLSKVSDKDIAAALAKFADKALRDGVMSDDDAAVLKSLFDSYWDDPEVMDAFYAEFGGDQTGELLRGLEQQLNSHDRDNHVLDAQGIAELASKVRASLANSSAGWGSSRAKEFAQGLFKNPNNHVGLGVLFDGPPFMGAELAKYSADEVDRWERDKGRPMTVTSDLARLLSGGQAADIAGRVFETLGQYPEYANDFLMSGDTPNFDRIDYWFGERNWSVYDKFEGPMALWEGSQRIPGGPAGGLTGAYDAEAWKKAAASSSAIMNALFGNPTFLSDEPGGRTYLSDSASVSLAAALSYILPYMSEDVLFGQGMDQEYLRDNIHENPWSFVDLLAVNGAGRPSPTVGWDALAKLMGVAGSHAGGAQVLVGAEKLYSDALNAIAAGSSDPVVAGKARERVAALNGFVAGAVAGTRIDGAARADAEVARQVDVVMGVLGAIPVPGLGSVLKGVGSTIVDGVTSYSLGEVQDQLGNAVKDAASVKDAQGVSGASREALQEAMAKDLLREGMASTGIGGKMPAYDSAEWKRLWDAINRKLNESGAQNLDSAISEWDKSYSYGKDGVNPR